MGSRSAPGFRHRSAHVDAVGRHSAQVISRVSCAGLPRRGRSQVRGRSGRPSTAGWDRTNGCWCDRATGHPGRSDGRWRRPGDALTVAARRRPGGARTCACPRRDYQRMGPGLSSGLRSGRWLWRRVSCCRPRLSVDAIKLTRPRRHSPPGPWSRQRHPAPSTAATAAHQWRRTRLRRGRPQARRGRGVVGRRCWQGGGGGVRQRLPGDGICRSDCRC
jgi:hypothetical protein